MLDGIDQWLKNTGFGAANRPLSPRRAGVTIMFFDKPQSGGVANHICIFPSISATSPRSASVARSSAGISSRLITTSSRP